jgi:hypothetical protein
MALTNYAELQTAVADFLNRDDLTSIIPTFIKLAEAQISRDLLHWKQQKRVVTTLNEPYENLPNDIIKLHNVVLDNVKQVKPASDSEIGRLKLNSEGVAEPKYYTLNSGQIEFIPTPAQDYELTLLYSARISSLSNEIVDNWLLVDYPDIYLYGALLQSAPYLQEDARVPVWAQLYSAAIANANAQSENMQFSGSSLVMRNV